MAINMNGNVDFMDRVQLYCYSNVENCGELVSRTDEKTRVSSTTKINDSLKQCGASETCTQIAILIIDHDPVGMDLITVVKGTAFDVQELGSAAYCTMDKAATIAKYFKVTPQELEISTLEAAVVTRLAIKDLL
jgi:hypothetical protein